jgi:hypothetical protein
MATPVVQLDRRHFVGEPSIIIFQENGVVYALNVKTRAIVAQGGVASTVIQKAIDALANGGRLFIKQGLYVLNATLKVKTGIVFEGEGFNTVFKVADNTPIDAIDVEDAENVVLRNFTVDGNKANNAYASGQQFTVKIAGKNSITKNVVVENLYVHDGADGIFCANCDGVVVKSCVVESCKFAGLVASGGAKNVKFIECTSKSNEWHGLELCGGNDEDILIEGCSFIDNADKGVVVNNGRRVRIVGNLFYNNKYNVHVECWDTWPGSYVEDIVISGNIILRHDDLSVNNTLQSVRIVIGAQEPKKITIADNIIFGGFDGSIQITKGANATADKARRVIIEGNYINDVNRVSRASIDVAYVDDLTVRGNIVECGGVNGYRGIWTAYVTDAHIEGNTVFGFPDHGIWIDYTTSALICDNVVHDCLNGIVVPPSSSRVTIRGNRIYNMKQRGLWIATWGVIVEDNYIEKVSLSQANAYDAICIEDNGDNAQVKNNIIILDSNARYGIYLADGAQNCDIFANMLEGSPGTGFIRVYDATTRVRRNRGYITENSGIATISANSTRVTVSHGLASAPLKVLITALAQPAGKLWVENITSTSFDIVTDTAPTSNLPIAWYAEV